MRMSIPLLILFFSGCGVEAAPQPEPTSNTERQALTSFTPMGFARVDATGRLITGFNSTGGAITVTNPSPGEYELVFAGLAPFYLGFFDGEDGNVQITAEGGNSTRCGVNFDAIPSPEDLIVSVHCDPQQPATAFAVHYHNYRPFPDANSLPTTAAYTKVHQTGAIVGTKDYNSSGHHNTVEKLGVGQYRVTITNATSNDASVMVSSTSRLTACSILSASAGRITVRCHDRAGRFADDNFFLSYSATGPASWQQSAHALFYLAPIAPTYSSALGKRRSCSSVSITGTRSDDVGRVLVSGDLGSFDGGPFRRASFATNYGSPGYCKVYSIFNIGTAPNSSSTTAVNCYTPAGVLYANPTFMFTHVTSDLAGPCLIPE